MSTRILRTVQSISLIGVFILITVIFYQKTMQYISVDAGIAPYLQSLPTGNAKITLPKLSKQPRDDISILAERPLFEKTRRPPEKAAVVAQPVQQAKPQLNAQLLGTIVQGTGTIAILKDSSSGNIFRLQVGSTFNGWEVVEISEESVMVTSGEDNMNLSISVKND